jgi:hypothetical protein
VNTVETVEGEGDEENMAGACTVPPVPLLVPKLGTGLDEDAEAAAVGVAGEADEDDTRLVIVAFFSLFVKCYAARVELADDLLAVYQELRSNGGVIRGGGVRCGGFGGEAPAFEEGSWCRTMSLSP